MDVLQRHKSYTSIYHPASTGALTSSARAVLFVLCLPCVYISACSQQLKPGWSLSRLAGTANLHIVPFIRLASTHNKTPLTRSLKIAVRTQCDQVVIALEWASINVLIYFLLLSIYKFFSPLFSHPKCDPQAINCWNTSFSLFFLFKADEDFFLTQQTLRRKIKALEYLWETLGCFVFWYNQVGDLETTEIQCCIKKEIIKRKNQ